MEELKKLCEDQEFLSALVEVETPEQLGELLSRKNIALEEGLTLEEAFKLVKEQGKEELSEVSLEEVSGGFALSVALGAAGAFTAGAAVLSFLAGYAHRTYKTIKKSKKR